MRNFKLLLLICVMCIPTINRADDELATITLWMYANQEESDLAIFKSAVESLGYEVNFEKTLDTQIIIMGSVGENDERINFRVQWLSQNSFLNEKSPDLYFRYDDIVIGNTIIQFDYIDSYDQLIQLMDIVLSYIFGNCETVKETADKLDLSTVEPMTASFISFALGNCHIYAGNYQLAIYRLRQALNYQTKHNREVYYLQEIAPTFNLAWTYVQYGYKDNAIQIMDVFVDKTKSQEYHPHWVSDALLHRAKIYALAFDYTAAIDDMDARLELYEHEHELARAYKQRGDIIMLIYEWNRALEDYNTAIELDPDYAEAYYRRGILLYTMVEREDAMADFETYLSLEPDGQFAESASDYIGNIQTELEALEGS